MIFLNRIFALATLSSIANGLHPPHLKPDQDHDQNRQSSAQQILSTTNFPFDATQLSILNDPQTLQEIFRSLTTSDAAHALDQPSAKEQLTPNPSTPQIVLGYPADHPPVKPTNRRGDDQATDHAPASLEIAMSTIGGFPIYHTPLALGTPAQPFRAWLNLTQNGLYVRSVTCEKRDCGRGWAYDSTKSSTRMSKGQRFEVHPSAWTVGGNVSTDVLRLVGVEVEEAVLGEVDDYQGEDMFYYVMSFVADGALGLAPPRANTTAYAPYTAPNPLHELMASHAVKHNTLTLTLPTNVNDERGSLQIGLPPDSHSHDAEMIRIPFGNQTSADLAGTWHVPLESVSLTGGGGGGGGDGGNNKQELLHLPLTSVYGRLELDPTLHLPPKTTSAIYAALGAKPNSIFRGASIDCRAREALPDLVLGIGGEEVRLTRDEYSSQQAVYGYPFCVVGILPSAGEGVAVLGTQVLGKFRVVVDLDGGELGLAERVGRD